MKECPHADNLTRYLDGALDPLESAAFSDHAATCEICRGHLDLWRRLGDLPEPAPGPALSRRFHRALDLETPGPLPVTLPALPALPAWTRWAAAAVLAVLCFSAGRWSAAPPSEAAELRGEVRSLRKLVALSLLSNDSASDRLKGLNYAARLPASSADVIDAMVAALRYDSNVNVRLAANDALTRFGADRRVRRAYLQALLEEESPMVKIALIDSLVAFEEREAAAAIARIEGSTGENQLVKERAARALEQFKEKGIQWQKH